MIATERKVGYQALDARSGEGLDLSMQELLLRGRILPAGAVLTVRHLFRLDTRRPAEVVYAFALPRDAALRRFKVQGEGFSVDSQLRKVEQAVDIYEKGLEAGSLSTLARQYGDGLVNLSVGNLRPGEEVSVLLELVAGVDPRDDGLRFRFPFTLAPGYHPRATSVAAQPGQGEIDLPEDEFEDLMLPCWREKPDGLHAVGFDLEIAMQGAISEIASPSHQLRHRSQEPGVARLSLATASEVPDRDLVLDVRSDSSQVSLQGALSPQGEGSFVAVIPSTLFGKAERQPRRVVFVVDRSGSMQGPPLDQAKRAVQSCLAALSEEDRFGVVIFDDRVGVFKKVLVKGSGKNRKAVARYLEKAGARGGTELAAGVSAGAGMLGEEGGDILLFTDGQVFGTERILAKVKRRAIRLHCLGIGSASQDRFLALLARSSDGACRFVTPRERVDLAAAELFASVKSPVAENLSAALEGEGDGLLDPRPARTVYRGSPLVVYGRTSGEAAATLRLSSTSQGRPQVLDIPVALQESPLYESCRLLQGARLITDLDSRLEAFADGQASVRKRKRPRLEKRLEKLSREYGLASRRMALVAVIRRKGDQPGQLPETQVVPVGLPQDVALESYFRPLSLKTAVSASAAMAVSAPGLAAGPPSPSPPSADYLMEACFSEEMMAAESDVEFVVEEGPVQQYADAIGQALEMAVTIEPDGGLPGGDAEERILHSLLALILLSLQGDLAGTTAFDPHLERLQQFITASLSALRPEQADIARRAAEGIGQGQTVEGDWLGRFGDAQRQLPESLRAELWREIDQEFGAR